MAPLLQEVREGGLATPEGLAYLEARQAVLSQYAACITAYLLLKAEGRNVKNHPVIGRWAASWACMLCCVVCTCVSVCDYGVPLCLLGGLEPNAACIHCHSMHTISQRHTRFTCTQAGPAALAH